ncbi:MAG: hypothetical protein ACLTPN_01550 [Clostridia bacterium]|mgnify:FL=1
MNKKITDKLKKIKNIKKEKIFNKIPKNNSPNNIAKINKAKINKSEFNIAKTIFSNKAINKKYILLFLLFIILIIFLFSKNSLGKQMSNTKINTNSEIAKPILIVENNPAIDITNKNNKGYYDFKIKNYNELGEINEIELRYNIEILNEENKAIKFKLYKGEEELLLEKNKTKDMIIKKNEKQEENYKLEITYDKNLVSSLEDIIQNVQIKVHSEQLKS